MISAQFFSTINLKLFLKSLYLLTLKLPYLRYGDYNNKFIKDFKDYLGANNSKVFTFYNGRSALYYALKSLKSFGKDEVIVPAYTCVSVINAIKQAGYKPIYADIDDSLNISINTIQKLITHNTIAIIVQHTFGNPADIKKIVDLAHSHNIYVIEDCAHSLGAMFFGKKVGLFGDMAIFSTGRDKVISSITGGILVVNNSKIEISTNLIMPNRILVIKNLLYNIIAYIAWKTYDIKLGKLIMYLAVRLGIIPPILTPNEKTCKFNKFNYLLPNSLAYLAYYQLKEIDKINSHRIMIANFYKKTLGEYFIFPKTLPGSLNIYFGVPILIKDKCLWEKIVKTGKKQNIYFGVYWSGQSIVPINSNLISCDYNIGSCPNAELFSKQVLILPNHYQISLKDAGKIVNLLTSFIN